MTCFPRSASEGQVFAPGAIRNVADTYVQNLILANAALKSGVDKDPRVQKLLELVRNRTLAEAYRHAAEEEIPEPFHRRDRKILSREYFAV